MSDQYNLSDSHIPEPPASEVTIRTMESDLKSIQEGGGVVNSPGLVSAYKPTRNEEEKSSLSVVGYTGPEKAIFEQAPSPVAEPVAEANPQEKKSSAAKFIIVGLLVILGIAGLGALSYYLVTVFVQ